MKFFVEYFGLFIFGFVVLVGGLVALPEIGGYEMELGGMARLLLDFIVIVGGFSWYYSADLPSGVRSSSRTRRESDSSTL